MNGRFARLDRLGREHEESLWSALTAGGDPALWDFLPYGPFADRAAFAAWQAECRSSEDPQFWAISGESGAPAGQLALMRWTPEHRVVEVGHIALGPALQRTRAATEAIVLVMTHVFDELGYRRLEWKCDARNARSRRAAERFGFTYEGTFRKHMLVNGRDRDTAWFSVIDDEWPERREAFARWLDPGNFDAAGRQRTPLG